jgi:hypothetical protein
MITLVGIKGITKDKIGDWSNISDLRYLHTSRYLDVEADCYIQWNIYNPYRRDKDTKYQYVLNSGKPFIVCEESVFREYRQYKRIGWSNFKNNLGNFNNKNCNSSRWKKFQKDTKIKINDWNSPGDNILIMCQLEYDAALIELYQRGYKSFKEYLLSIIQEVRKHTDRKIVVRPHPKDLKSYRNFYIPFTNVELSINYTNEDPLLLSGGKGLHADLNNAYCVITYNSNSAIDAICKGIPTFTLDKTSPAYEIGHKDLSKIESLDYNIDISTWCNEIAYTIWNPAEIKSGETWNHLKEVI